MGPCDGAQCRESVKGIHLSFDQIDPYCCLTTGHSESALQFSNLRAFAEVAWPQPASDVRWIAIIITVPTSISSAAY
jgi:hypothetical protein